MTRRAGLSRFLRTIRDSQGQGLAEYIVIAILVAILVILAIKFFGGSVTGQFENATQQVRTIGEGGSSKVADSTALEREPKEEIPSTGKSTARSEKPRHETVSEENEPGGESDVDKEIRRLRKGSVAGEDVNAGADIELDWKTLAVIAIVVIGLGIAIVMRGGGKKTKPKTKKKRKKLFSRDDSGQAIVEFVLSAITFLFVILGVIQLAMVLNAYALVRYAAYNAARAAIVHNGDHGKMVEAARISLLATFPAHGHADHVRGITENYLASQLTDSIPFVFTGTLDSITEVKILDNNNVGGGEVVTFDDPEAGTKPIITVQVVHRYELVIPLVNRITYFVYQQIKSAGHYSGESLNRMSAETDVMRRPGGEYHDIEYRIPIVAHYTMRMQSDYAASSGPTTIITTTTSTTTTSTTIGCVNHSGYCGDLACGFTCPSGSTCYVPWSCWPTSCQQLCCPSSNGHCISHWGPGGSQIGYAGEACSCN